MCCLKCLYMTPLPKSVQMGISTILMQLRGGSLSPNDRTLSLPVGSNPLYMYRLFDGVLSEWLWFVLIRTTHNFVKGRQCMTPVLCACVGGCQQGNKWSFCPPARPCYDFPWSKIKDDFGSGKPVLLGHHFDLHSHHRGSTCGPSAATVRPKNAGSVEMVMICLDPFCRVQQFVTQTLRCRCLTCGLSAASAWPKTPDQLGWLYMIFPDLGWYGMNPVCSVQEFVTCSHTAGVTKDGFFGGGKPVLLGSPVRDLYQGVWHVVPPVRWYYCCCCCSMLPSPDRYCTSWQDSANCPSVFYSSPTKRKETERKKEKNEGRKKERKTEERKEIQFRVVKIATPEA